MSEPPSHAAVRRYRVDGQPDRAITLTIQHMGAEPTGDFACMVLIEGTDEPMSKKVLGVDGIQALQLALDCARRELEASGLPLTWFDSEAGDLGLPRTIDGGLGLWFQRRLEDLIDREVEHMQKIALAVLNEHARRRQNP